MPKLTITVDAQLLKELRVKAHEEGMSLDALLRSFLKKAVRDAETRRKAMEDILALSRSCGAPSGRRRWTRDELHERDA